MALTMHVHDVLHDAYSVDICKSTTDKLTSFRDSLIFMGHATFVTSQKLMVRPTENFLIAFFIKGQSTFYNCKFIIITLQKLNPMAVRKYFYGKLKLSKYISVVCTHVESPDSIYVIKVSYLLIIFL